MILGYTLPNAEESIKAGIKIHTLRSDRVQRWKPGYIIHHATGTRSKDYNCFLENKCISVQQVLLIYVNGQVKITVDRRRLSKSEVKQFAINDGFKDVAGLIDWFFKKDTMWAGRLIHWTNFKY